MHSLSDAQLLAVWERGQRTTAAAYMLAIQDCQAFARTVAEFLTSIGGSEIYNVLGGMSAWEGERVQAR